MHYLTLLKIEGVVKFHLKFARTSQGDLSAQKFANFVQFCSALGSFKKKKSCKMNFFAANLIDFCWKFIFTASQKSKILAKKDYEAEKIFFHFFFQPSFPGES